MVIECGKPSRAALNLFALTMAAFAVFVAGKRAGQPTGLLDCSFCLEMKPYAPFAAQLEQAGFSGRGTILAGGIVSGNLRVTFPKARVIDLANPDSSWPEPAGEGQCLLVWPASAGTQQAVPQPYLSFLADRLRGQPEAAHRDGTVTAPMLAPAKGEMSLAYRLYDAPNGACR